MKYIVSYSGGLGSFMAAWLTARKKGADNCILIFADTKTEDIDLYRFVSETVEALGIEFHAIVDGRNIWEVFTDVRFHGNRRIDPCSKILKRQALDGWIKKNGYTPENSVRVVGIDHTEQHRLIRIRDAFSPWQTYAPLCEPEVLVSKEDILDVLESLEIKPPRLYEMGFPHNNCGGFCIKTGQRQMKLLLEKLPDTYRWHEEREEKLFTYLNKRHGSIRRVINGEMQYLGLKDFRELVEKGENLEMFPEAGCACIA